MRSSFHPWWRANPQKRGWARRLQSWRIPWKKRFLESQSVKGKSEHYGRWCEWNIRCSGGGNGGDTITQGLQIWGAKLWLIQNTKRKLMKRITENVGRDKKKIKNERVLNGLRPFWPKWKKISEKSKDKHEPSKFFSLLCSIGWLQMGSYNMWVLVLSGIYEFFDLLSENNFSVLFIFIYFLLFPRAEWVHEGHIKVYWVKALNACKLLLFFQGL